MEVLFFVALLSLAQGLLSLQCQPLPVQRTQRIGVAGRHWERVGVAGVGRISLSSAIPFEDSRYILNPLQRRLSIPAQRGPISFKFKGKAINLWSLAYAAVTLCVALVILPFMMLMTVLVDLFGNKRQRRILDWAVHLWAKLTMKLTFSDAKVYGLENLPAHGESVVYVPNHTSYFDILMLSGYIPRPFKYLSKSEILDIPVVGYAMKLAKHVFLRRNDLKSTVECAEKCVERLNDGNSMVLFAEGSRSLDGSLKQFKKGAFQMAKQAGVKVIPISIGNLYRWMPDSTVLPLGPIRNAYIKIHPAITTTDKKVKEIKNLCFKAVNSGLPPYQKYWEDKSESMSNVYAEEKSTPTPKDDISRVNSEEHPISEHVIQENVGAST